MVPEGVGGGRLGDSLRGRVLKKRKETKKIATIDQQNVARIKGFELNLKYNFLVEEYKIAKSVYIKTKWLCSYVFTRIMYNTSLNYE